MSVFKRIARTKIQRGYQLRPPLWSGISERYHQTNRIQSLINDNESPLKYIFGLDEETNNLYAFEQEVISDVVLDGALELQCAGYLTAATLDNILCCAAAATYCALQERMGTACPSIIEFTVAKFKPIYDSLNDYISTNISVDEGLLKRWNDYKSVIFARLQELVIT
ncbi:hypothetical protein BDR04DRAFT_1164490 [Suillus decipiens]|nr:hypothetical protein BDR04DRAFT_1164490 [Suillus decipiens]